MKLSIVLALLVVLAVCGKPATKPTPQPPSIADSAKSIDDSEKSIQDSVESLKDSLEKYEEMAELQDKVVKFKGDCKNVDVETWEANHCEGRRKKLLRENAVLKAWAEKKP